MARSSTSKRVRRRSIGDSPLHDLLHSLNVDQLKGLAAVLEISLESKDTRKKSDLIEVILTSGRSQSSIKERAYETESNTPYSNLFVTGMKFSRNNSFSAFEKFIEKSSTGHSGIKKAFSEIDESGCLITFEHRVTAREWKLDEDRGGLFPHDSVLRHPLVFRFNPKLSVVTINYPGFNQGPVDQEERVEYEDVIENVLKWICETCGAEVAALPVRQSINLLCDSKSRRLVLIGANPANIAGVARIRVKANQARVSIDRWLTENIQRFGGGIDHKVLANAIYLFVREMSQDVISVHWVDEKISSRVTAVPPGN